MPAPFAPGDRVKLHCLRSRPELNGTAAEILEYHPDVDKYSVSIAAGERFRVAAKNVTPATPPPPPSVGAATPPPTPPAPKDPTIFVSGGQFLQPLAPLVRAGPRPPLAPHCEELPAGHWEVRWVEVENGYVTVTLYATEKHDDCEPDVWNALGGLTITRIVALDKEAGPSEVVTGVDGGVLAISLLEPAAVPDADATMAEPMDEEDETRYWDAKKPQRAPEAENIPENIPVA